jgi:hypothetical protein
MNTMSAANFVLLGRAAVSGSNYLTPVQVNSVGPTSGAAWYTQGGNAQAIKLLNGFETSFNFTMTNQSPVGSCHGFDFVLQAQGSDAANLGYAGIPQYIAIKFDPNQDTNLNDPGAPQV